MQIMEPSEPYNWLDMANEPTFAGNQVGAYKHAPMADIWDHIVAPGIKVEVQSEGDSFWIATVIKVVGYMAKLRYEGYEDDSSKDFWVYLFSNNVHPVGWCTWQGKALVPPRGIDKKANDWTTYLIQKLTGSRTLPENFSSLVQDCLETRFKPGLKLEVVDKSRISAVRVATVHQAIGGRLLVLYDGAEDYFTGGFWCHEQSPLVHPIGWAQFVGHELKATFEYAKKSLEKVITRHFDETDATWDMFDIPDPETPTDHGPTLKFTRGMKLEAIDPLNLSTICVATVTKVLRANYLMIGIDGVMSPTGSDWFCYHATSPCIFPAGFCKKNQIELTPPRGYENFEWDEYLKQTNSYAAPERLFSRNVPDHGFKEGMLVEAVDLMQPRLVCVATITKVVGRLLRIHFNGWEEALDQWCDCESPELFPIGWCKLVGYRLEPPYQLDANQNTSNGNATIVKRRRTIYKGRTKRRRLQASVKNTRYSSEYWVTN
ncbi:MBT domain-containing protein 1 [Fragariocoptes setiger]|uniref:MBT domain-containing protein 1 n=1 Tax=Fragariocoptes setiger TaxID=1670756 RepID=A0ABQ7SBT6_9ACAR|nr:MBT domain-containing protein 1 [Fragariocoptes setiger]